MHIEEKFKANSIIPKPCHVSNIKGNGEDSEWSSDHAKEEPINEQTIIKSKAHIPGPSTSVSQIPRDEAVKERGNTDEEIDRFTSVPKKLHSLCLKHKQEHPTTLIFYLEGLKRCMSCWLHIS